MTVDLNPGQERRVRELIDSGVYKDAQAVVDRASRGQRRREVTRSDFRFWNVPSFSKYTIVYDSESRPWRIVRILRGARDIRRELRRK